MKTFVRYIIFLGLIGWVLSPQYLNAQCDNDEYNRKWVL